VKRHRIVIGSIVLALLPAAGRLLTAQAPPAPSDQYSALLTAVQSQPVDGALAIAPSDPNVVWAGTGEAFLRSNISIGNGIYKSTNAGKTWTHAGLDNTGRIAPHRDRSPQCRHCLRVRAWSRVRPAAGRGVFRCTDGGRTWERSLFLDENTGCSDVAMDATNPRVLFAGMWHVEIHTWARISGGPGRGLYRSVDGGATWQHLTGHGLPASPLGKISPQVARSNPNRVSMNRGRTWHQIQLPIAQMYHVATDNQVSYNVYGDVHASGCVIGIVSYCQ
jgi:hypothetical protein